MHILDIFRTSPYEDFNAEKYPVDVRGWGSDDPVFDELVTTVRPLLILEVGTWKGASAIHMANASKLAGLKTRIVCIDTWLGSVEFWYKNSGEERDLVLKNGYPSIYYQFLANVVRAGHQDTIIPFPQTSLIAARWLASRKIQADLIYIDGSHDYDDVLADIKAYWSLLRPGGVMFGDDLNTFVDVSRALKTFTDTTKPAAMRQSDRVWQMTK